MKLRPIGLSDYKRLISEDFYYVDKTLLIEELVLFGALITYWVSFRSAANPHLNRFSPRP